MSEQGWRQFLAAEGVDDWVVLHGGASAVFRVPSLGEAESTACPHDVPAGACLVPTEHGQAVQSASVRWCGR